MLLPSRHQDVESFVDLSNHLCRFSKIRAPPHSIRLGQIILNQPQSDVVAHLVQLLVDFYVIALVVFA